MLQQSKTLNESCKEIVCGHSNFAPLETLEGFAPSRRVSSLKNTDVLYLGQ